MLAHALKRRSIHNLGTIFALLWLLSPALYAQDDGDGMPLPPPSGATVVQAGVNSPPVQQTLVPESVLATQLAEALKLGAANDEAKAETLLSGVGIEPSNGWITDYPVTPMVLGDIEKDVAAASDNKKIALNKKQALKMLGDLKTKLGLNVNPGAASPDTAAKSAGNTTIYSYIDNNGVVHFTDVYESIPKAYQAKAKIVSQASPHTAVNSAGNLAATAPPDPQYIANPNPDDLNDYYYQQGPPVLTYYAPPDPYAYLYSWVDYPFWSTGYYFPGYFILNNFHRQVVYNQHPYFVANHANGVGVGHPLNGGINRPVQVGAPMPNGVVAGHGFASPNAQAGASAIMAFNPSQHRTMGIDAARQPTATFGGTPRISSNAPAFSNNHTMTHNGSFRPAPYGNGNMINQPSYNQHAFVPNTPRYYNAPAYAPAPVYRAPPAFNGNFSGGFQGGGNFGNHAGGFQGGGSFGGHAGGFGGGFGGGARGGGGHR